MPTHPGQYPPSVYPSASSSSPYAPSPFPHPGAQAWDGRIPKKRRLEEHELPMYKTKKCTYWEKSGTCKLADKCSFFHEGVDRPRGGQQAHGHGMGQGSPPRY